MKLKNGTKLSDEELSKVAGGMCYETADDTRFLNSLNGSVDRLGQFKVMMTRTIAGQVEKAWADVGIEAKVNKSLYNSPFDKNTYKLNGKVITQEQARQHAMEVTGHHMNENEWNW